MQVCLSKSPGVRGVAEALEIAGCRHDHQRLVDADRQGDHVLRNHRSEPQARVESFGHDVHEASFGDQIDLHIRKVRHELDDERQDSIRRVRGSVETDRPGGMISQVVNSGDRRGDSFQRRPDPREERCARLGERHAAGVAQEHADAQSRFEVCHHVAHGRGRHVEFVRGASKTAMSGDGVDDVEGAQSEIFHCPESFNSMFGIG